MRRLLFVLLAACSGAKPATTTTPPPSGTTAPTASTSAVLRAPTLPPHLVVPGGVESDGGLPGWTPPSGALALACASAQGHGSAENDVDAVPGTTNARLARAVSRCGAKAGARFVLRVEATAARKVVPRAVVMRTGADDKVAACVLAAMKTMPLEPLESLEPDGKPSARTFDCWVASY